jgi:hypothetical protein
LGAGEGEETEGEEERRLTVAKLTLNLIKGLAMSQFDFLFHRNPRPAYIVLTVNNVGCILEPNERALLMTPVNVGHKINMSIEYLDQNGNPMLITPVPSSPPSWSNTNAAAETLAPAPDGNTCIATAIAPGSDTVNLSLMVGGQTFAASLAVTVQTAPQVLTSIEIVPVVT